MGLSEAARERRRRYVGASDVAAVMGLSPFATPADVWAEKVYGSEDITNEAMELGSAMEAGLRVMAEARLGATKKAGPFRVLESTRRGVNLDCYREDDGIEPIELKTAGLLNPNSPHLAEWGADWTDEVPAHYLIQVMAQIAATNAKRGWLCALVAGRGFCVYRIERDDDIISMMLESVAAFWRSVEARERPEHGFASVETLSRIVRRPGSVAEMPEDMLRDVVAWRQAAAVKRAADKHEEAAKARVIAWLGDNEAAALPAELLPEWAMDAIAVADENVRRETLATRVAVTYLEQSRSGVDIKALERDHPALLARYRTESRFRVLRHAKLKPELKIDPTLALSPPAAALKEADRES